MSELWDILRREDNCLSLPRVCALISFVIVCGLLIGEAFGFEVKHLPEFMTFTISLFGWCAGSKYLDIKKGGAYRD